MVVSVDPDLREFASALEIEKPEVAAWPPFLSAIAAEASRAGREASAGPISLVFALSEPPRPPATPEGLDLRRVDRDWMNAEQHSGRFPNAVGSPERAARAERNVFALGLFDGAGEPVAVAGVFETLGLHEIGVDVVPASQGRGLAPIVVTAAAHAILELDAAPMYACAATNTRSQRTAIASGFLPVASDAFVSASGFLPVRPDAVAS
jgi:RimJ/RimL family protein N-acetyltransferase